jgi:HAD superfamily hydrolase (TIGR01509 family)
VPSNFRAVFFDAGNTLIFPRLDDAAAKMTALGYPATVEDFHAAERYGKGRHDEWLWPQIRNGDVPGKVDHYYWGEYLAGLMERLKIPETERGPLMLRVADQFKDITLWSFVLPDTRQSLHDLRDRGYYLGVISNSLGTVEEQLMRLGLAEHFDTVVDSAVVGVEKPHPEIFAIALGRARSRPSETIFVGDTYSTDVGGAKLAGLSGILMDRVGAYPNADCPRVKSLSELIGLIEELENQ